jgi:hypothetical protein
MGGGRVGGGGGEASARGGRAGVMYFFLEKEMEGDILNCIH